MEHNEKKKRIILLVVCLVILLLSFFVFADIAASPDRYTKSISALDEEKATVLKLTAATAAVSAGISALPTDVGDPIADELAGFSTDFLAVLCAIYLEKYLLTITGYAGFKILIPFACIIFGICLFTRDEEMKGSMERIARKLVVFAIAIMLVIPASVRVSCLIQDTYEDSINETVNNAVGVSQSLTGEAPEDTLRDDAATEEDKTADGEKTTLKDIFGSVSEEAGKLKDTVTGIAGTVTGKIEAVINGFVEAAAVMIVTSCVIPVFVLVFFVWLVKVILGVDIDFRPPMRKRRPGGKTKQTLIE